MMHPKNIGRAQKLLELHNRLRGLIKTKHYHRNDREVISHTLADLKEADVYSFDDRFQAFLCEAQEATVACIARLGVNIKELP